MHGIASQLQFLRADNKLPPCESRLLSLLRLRQGRLCVTVSETPRRQIGRGHTLLSFLCTHAYNTTPSQTCRSYGGLFDCLGCMLACSAHECLERHHWHLSTSDDGFASLRHESVPGENASTTTTTTPAAIWNMHSRAITFLKPANSNSNQALDLTHNSPPRCPSPARQTSSQRSTSQQTLMASYHRTIPHLRSWETAVWSSRGRSR